MTVAFHICRRTQRSRVTFYHYTGIASVIFVFKCSKSFAYLSKIYTTSHTSTDTKEYRLQSYIYLHSEDVQYPLQIIIVSNSMQ